MIQARRIRRALTSLLLAAATPALAQEAWFELAFEEVEFDEGAAPAWLASASRMSRWRTADPYVWIEGGEGYLVGDEGRDVASRRLRVVIRLPELRAGRGTLFLPAADGEELEPHPFRFGPERASEAARAVFLCGRYEHYEGLRQRPIPGAAWFRHRADAARRELLELGAELPRVSPSPWELVAGRTGELEDTYALFSGGRALSENLALDRVLEGGAEAEASVDLAGIEGVSIAEMDWAARALGLEPALDPLASLIPADQHALFFASFGALVDLVDEVAASGAPLLQLVEPRSESARSLELYQRQMCLQLDELARALGPMLVESVAVTGSDPYFRTGTDVALLFETRRPEALLAFVRAAQQRAVSDAGAAPVAGEIGSAEYVGADSGDFRVSSYAARFGDVVAVSNALHQLEQVAAVLAGERAALAGSLEYVFFRDRYPRGAEDESAFLMLTDATIRRWCGPRWRIGASRRLRAAALMAEEQARHLEELVAGGVEPRTLRAQVPVPGAGAVRLAREGVISDGYGSLRFLTPIALLDLELVTPAERRGYELFRAQYESNWRKVFDPIAARLLVREGELALDLSVMPLIAGSDYRELTELCGDAALDPYAGDPHPGALYHAIYAVDHATDAFRRMDQALGLFGDFGGTGLAWMGGSFELYVDDDALWEELMSAEDPRSFFVERIYDLPVALRVPVRDPLRLAAFLTALRTVAGQTAPGLVRWESREHEGEPYVAILPAEGGMDFVDLSRFGLYYVPGPDALVVSLREDLIQRSLDRRRARAAAKDAIAQGVAEKAELRAWLGHSTAMRLERTGIELFAGVLSDELRRGLQRRAWSNLPILNEWRRLHPELDPIELHERHWHVRLLEPEGGEYVWNAERHTYESSVFGHPGLPRRGPRLAAALRPIREAALGLGFEPGTGSDDGGLRARVRVLRENR